MTLLVMVTSLPPPQNWMASGCWPSPGWKVVKLLPETTTRVDPPPKMPSVCSSWKVLFEKFRSLLVRWAMPEPTDGWTPVGIDELEPAQRGVYGGVVGYFDLAGDADLAIAIRTATLVGGMARIQAGAGLVADSDPVAEHLEAKNKAAAPLRAVAIANAMRRVR